MAEAIERDEFRSIDLGSDFFSGLKRDVAVLAIMNDQRLTRLCFQKLHQGEVIERTSPDPFEPSFERTSPGLLQSPMIAKSSGHSQQSIGTRDKHDARDIKRVWHRRKPLSRNERNHASERMRNDRAKGPEFCADYCCGAGTVDQIG